MSRSSRRRNRSCNRSVFEYFAFWMFDSDIRIRCYRRKWYQLYRIASARRRLMVRQLGDLLHVTNTIPLTNQPNIISRCVRYAAWFGVEALCCANTAVNAGAVRLDPAIRSIDDKLVSIRWFDLIWFRIESMCFSDACMSILVEQAECRRWLGRDLVSNITRFTSFDIRNC